MSSFHKSIAVACLCSLFLLFTNLIFVCQVYAGANANATISIDLVPNGGQGNQIDDGVTSGTVSGQSTKIVVEVFARGVTTQLIGVSVIFDFNTSLLRFNRAENNAFVFALPQPDGTNFANASSVILSPSGFLARAEFTTVADVTGQAFSIGIKSVTLAENSTSTDIITSSSTISFNGATTDTGIQDVVEPIAGDLDFDGDVDIADFLTFAENFGKTGPVPTRPSGQPTERIVTVTVHDTIYIESGGTPQEERAEKMLGFWQFKGGTLFTEYYVIGHIDYDNPDDDGEIPYFGSNDLGVLVGGYYFQDQKMYALLHQSILINYFYLFEIQGDRVAGKLYFFLSSQSLSDASIYTLSSISGRTGGTGFTSYAGKPAVKELEPNDQLNKSIVPQDVIDAYNRTKAILDTQRGY